MKFLMIALLALNFSSVLAHADACSDYIQQSVITQAETDLNRNDLLAVLPPIYDDGGSVESYNVPVVAESDTRDVLATYSIMVNEVCGIIHLNRIQPQD